MDIALLDGGAVARIGDHRALFPNTSFPPEGPDDEFLAENGAARVSHFIEHDRLTHKLVPCDPYVAGGVVYVVKFVKLTAEDLEAKAASAAAGARASRDRLLAASDWTQLADAPVDRTAWAEYRRLLRDLTAQPGFPHEISWPEKPLPLAAQQGEPPAPEPSAPEPPLADEPEAAPEG